MLRLGRRVFEFVVLDGAGSRDDVIEAVVDSNIVMWNVLLVKCFKRIALLKCKCLQGKPVSADDVPTCIC